MTNLFDHLLARFRADRPGAAHLDEFVAFCKQEMTKVPVVGLSPAVEGFGLRLANGSYVAVAVNPADPVRGGDTQYAGAVGMNNPGFDKDTTDAGSVAIHNPK